MRRPSLKLNTVQEGYYYEKQGISAQAQRELTCSCNLLWFRQDFNPWWYAGTRLYSVCWIWYLWVLEKSNGLAESNDADQNLAYMYNGKDIVKEFIDACHENNILPFLYHTTADWHHPAFENDFKEYLKYLRASLEVLCRNYGRNRRVLAGWKLEQTRWRLGAGWALRYNSQISTQRDYY